MLRYGPIGTVDIEGTFAVRSYSEISLKKYMLQFCTVLDTNGSINFGKGSAYLIR